MKGFDSKEIENRGISVGLDTRIVIPCFNDPTKMQVNALNPDDLEKARACTVA